MNRALGISGSSVASTPMSAASRPPLASDTVVERQAASAPDPVASFSDAIRKSAAGRKRAYILTGDHSDAANYLEYNTTERRPLKRDDLSGLAPSMRLVPVPDAGEKSYTEAVLLLRDGDPSEVVPAKDLDDAVPSRSAVITFADDLFDVPNPPIPRDTRFTLPIAVERGEKQKFPRRSGPTHMTAEQLLTQMYPPEGLGACVQVELGGTAPTGLTREIGDELLAIVKAAHRKKFVAITDASHAFYAQYIPDALYGVPDDRLYGINTMLRTNGGNYRDAYSGDPTGIRRGRYTAREPVVMTTQADDVTRQARRFFDVRQLS